MSLFTLPAGALTAVEAMLARRVFLRNPEISYLSIAPAYEVCRRERYAFRVTIGMKRECPCDASKPVESWRPGTDGENPQSSHTDQLSIKILAASVSLVDGLEHRIGTLVPSTPSSSSSCLLVHRVRAAQQEPLLVQSTEKARRKRRGRSRRRPQKDRVFPEKRKQNEEKEETRS